MRAYTSIRTQTHGVTGHTTPRHMPRTDTHPNLDLASAATGPGRPRVRRLPYRSGCHTAAIFTPPSPPRRLELRSIKRRGGGGSTPPCAMAAAGCGAGSSLYLRERAGCKRVGLGWGAGSRSGFAREESPSRGFGAAAGHDTSEAAAAGGCGWWARQRAGGGAASAAGGGDGGGDGGGGGGGGGDGVAAPGGYPLKNVHVTGDMQLLLSMDSTMAGVHCACSYDVSGGCDELRYSVLSRGATVLRTLRNRRSCALQPM